MFICRRLGPSGIGLFVIATGTIGVPKREQGD
jgi:hypothetical protein